MPSRPSRRWRCGRRGDQALRRVDNAVASALIGAVYDSLVAVWDGPEADMQRTLAKLRESEMAGFQRVYADMRVKATPQEITGEKWVGGYFQFLSYCTWKLAARTVQGADPAPPATQQRCVVLRSDVLSMCSTTQLKHILCTAARPYRFADPEDVRAFYQSVGRRVAGRLLPGRIAALQEAAAAAPTGRAPASATAAAVQDLMGRLQQAGYLQSWSLIWGEQPSLGNAKARRKRDGLMRGCPLCNVVTTCSATPHALSLHAPLANCRPRHGCSHLLWAPPGDDTTTKCKRQHHT